MKRIFSWVRFHVLAVIVGISLSIIYLIQLVPPHSCCFIWQRRIEAISQIIGGILNFTLIPGIAFPYSISQILQNIILLFVLGTFIGILIELLWKNGWRGRAPILLTLIFNGFFGYFVVIASDTLVGRVYASCEKELSEDVKIIIKAYPERGIIPGAHFFAMETRDSGRTWRQIMYFRYDDQIKPRCENIGYLSLHHYWIWMGWKMAVTTDGGRNWSEWSPRETWPNWICCNYLLIENVVFDTESHGRMDLDVTRRNQIPYLITEDSGISWLEP